MPSNLSALFMPNSVAVIGASDDLKKAGAVIFKNILESGFKGSLFPVNPNTPSVQGHKCYAKLAEVEEPIDLVIVCVPASIHLQIFEEIGQKGIKNAVSIAAGFKETGPEGAKLEQDLITLCQKYGINLLGPNCLGFVNNLCPINATFGSPPKALGNLRFISQSGAIATGIFDWCNSTNLSFAEFISLGNKSILNENDVLEYLSNLSDDHYQNIERINLSSLNPIGLYLESISDGQRFLKVCKNLIKNDPIFIIKPGKTKDAASAMQSHTGAIAGSDAVFDAAMKEVGIIRAETLEDFFDFARAFSLENPPLGPRVAVVSNAGGPAVISADAITISGLEMAQFDEATKKALTEILPRTAGIHNPLDVLGDALADRFSKASEIALKSPQVDSLVILLTPQVMTEIEKTAEGLHLLSQNYQKPIFCAFIGGTRTLEGEKILNEYKIPVFRYPERAINALSALWKYKKLFIKKSAPETKKTPVEINYTEISKIINEAKINNQPALNNLQADQLAGYLGILTPKTTQVANLEETLSFAKASGYPLVLKLSSPNLLHKKSLGGVITGIYDENHLTTSYNAISERLVELDENIKKGASVQIQKEIINGVEVIIGIKKDPNFGPILLFGAGGTLAELISDRNIAILPIDKTGIINLVENSKIFKALSGNGKQSPLALDKLYETIERFIKIYATSPDIKEAELNPAIVTLNNVFAVDTKVLLDTQNESTGNGPVFKTAEVINHQILAGNYHYFTLKSKEDLNFISGQYISVKVAPERINSYSIAGITDNQTFHLLIDISPGGPGSKYFEHLENDERISYLGPFGKFTLNLKDSANHLLFLATGSGLAPLKCMIEDALYKNKINLPVTLYLGVSTCADVFGIDYFEKLKKEFPNFNYAVAVWKPDEKWSGACGFITELVKENFPDAKEVSAYLCGNKNMIADASTILEERGCPENRIYTEKF